MVSRDIGVTAATLTQWSDAFLGAGDADLKPHPVKESVEVGRLREIFGEQAMENALIREKIARMKQFLHDSDLLKTHSQNRSRRQPLSR